MSDSQERANWHCKRDRIYVRDLEATTSTRKGKSFGVWHFVPQKGMKPQVTHVEVRCELAQLVVHHFLVMKVDGSSPSLAIKTQRRNQR
jgi:hypothetical protein